VPVQPTTGRERYVEPYRVTNTATGFTFARYYPDQFHDYNDLSAPKKS